MEERVEFAIQKKVSKFQKGQYIVCKMGLKIEICKILYYEFFTVGLANSSANLKYMAR